MIKKPIFFRVISLLIVMLLVLSGMAIAKGVQTVDVEFVATETGNNIVKLTLTLLTKRELLQEQKLLQCSTDS